LTTILDLDLDPDLDPDPDLNPDRLLSIRNQHPRTRLRLALRPHFVWSVTIASEEKVAKKQQTPATIRSSN
jgi:hypothetical protein